MAVSKHRKTGKKKRAAVAVKASGTPTKWLAKLNGSHLHQLRTDPDQSRDCYYAINGKAQLFRK